MLTRPKLFASVPLAALVVAGCAANRAIPIRSTPSGATVSVNGHAVGTTPMIVTTDDLMPNRAFDGKPSTTAMLVIEKPGYASFQLLLKEFALPSEIVAELQADAAPPTTSTTAASAPDLLKELERLQELREKGAISEEEFQLLKQRAMAGSTAPNQQ